MVTRMNRRSIEAETSFLIGLRREKQRLSPCPLLAHVVNFVFVSLCLFSMLLILQGTWGSNTGGFIRFVEGQTTYKLGFIYVANDTDSFQTKLCADFAVQEVKKSSKFDFEFELITTAVASRGAANTAVLDMVGQKVIGIVGPPRTSINLITAVTGGNFLMPTLSPTATNRDLSDKAAYPYFLRTIPSDDLQAKALVDTCVKFGWREVAVLATTESYSVSIAQTFSNLAGPAGIQILTSIYFNTGKVDLKEELENIRSTGTRIIITLMLLADYRNVMFSASKRDLTGFPYVYFGADATSSAAVILNNKTVERAVLGSLSTSPRLANDSNNQYQRLINFLRKNSNVSDDLFKLGPYSTYAYDAVITYAYALKDLLNSRSRFSRLLPRAPPSVDPISDGDIDRRELLLALKAVDFRGLTGRVQFGANGDRLNGEYSINNFNDEEDSFLSPVGTWTNFTGTVITDDIRWPKDNGEVPDSTPRGPVDFYNCKTGVRATDPRGIVEIKDVDDDPDVIIGSSQCDSIIDCANWSDEATSCGSSLTSAIIALGVVAILLIVLLLWYLYIIFRYWKRGRIRASGGLFLKITCISSIIGMMSVFTYFGKAHTYVCQIRIWLWFPCAGMIVGALSTKQYRVWRVFGNPSLKKVVLTEKQLMMFTCLLCVPLVVILIIWTATDTYGRYSTKDDTGQHVVCGSELEILFFALLLGYLVLLLVCSSVLAFITRNFPSAFSESKLIGFALYNSTLAVTVLVPIVGVLQVQNLTAWVASVLTVMFFFTSTITIIMCPKIWGIYISDRGKPISELEKLPDSYSKSARRHGSSVSSASPHGSRSPALPTSSSTETSS